MATKYDWSEAPRTFKNANKANPNVIGRSLAEIAAAKDGRLEPKEIVEAAKSRTHPLHPFFEWNVKKAAEAHWLDTARRLTRSIVLIDPDKPEERPMRAWISVADEGTSYRGVREVLDEAGLQLAIMRRALSDLQGWLERYHSLEFICGSPLKTARDQLVEQILAAERKKAA